MLKDGAHFQDLGAGYYNPFNTERKINAYIVVLRLEPDEEHPQNLRLDAEYDDTEVVEQRDYVLHIQPRGGEKKEP